MEKTVRHIAVIRLSALGDVAMTVPVLLALTSQHPHVKVTVVSRPFFRPLFDKIPNVDFVSFEPKGRHKGITGLWRLSVELRKMGIEAFADLHDVLRSKVIRFFLKLSRLQTAAIDKGRSEKRALTHPAKKKFYQLKPSIQRYADVFAALGFSIDLTEAYYLSPQADVDIQEFICADHKMIGIAPFAQHASKVYPADLMQRVIDMLVADDASVLLFGSPAEKAMLARFASVSEKITVIAGELSFEQELALIAQLDVMIAMDSGNAHLAAICNVPTITLWGATHPFAGFGPYRQPDVNAFVSDRDRYPKIPTSVYGNKIVPGYEDAMRTIAPEAIVNRVNEIISGTPTHRRNQQ